MSVRRLPEPQLPRGWMLTLYPGAGEAGGCFVSARERVSGYVGGPAADPERAAVEAGRRARARLRRYCAANRLNRLGTLTYGPPRCTDPRAVRQHVGLFFRNLREQVGEPFPYAWVPELHKDGVHFHVHFAAGRYIPRQDLIAAWGRGFVHIKLLGDLPVGSGPWGEARKAAGYLSKYVAKTFLDEQSGHRPRGLHRFDVAQWFKPEAMRLHGDTAADVIAQASDLMGGAPVTVWSSDDVEGWQGPPALWVQWAG